MGWKITKYRSQTQVVCKKLVLGPKNFKICELYWKNTLSTHLYEVFNSLLMIIREATLFGDHTINQVEIHLPNRKVLLILKENKVMYVLDNDQAFNLLITIYPTSFN